MEFRVLGPLDVLDDGVPVEIAAAKQRALLAVLLLEANRVVSIDRLIDALWGDEPPDTAGKALQVYVSQLRKGIGRDRIVTRSPGYELVVSPGELDLERFETLAGEGRFVEALALWRGRPFADFAYERFAQSEITRLEELRLVCLERRIDADLEAGRHDELVAELDALVAEHPLRERLRGQLMLALYRSGRQAEALDAYRQGRRLFADELGLEPGADLRALQQAILTHDPSLDPPAVVPGERDGATRQEPSDEPARPLRQARKVVTVLSCGLTFAEATLDPEARRRVLERGHQELRPILERHGATVEGATGATVTAVFGVPAVREDDALRAVRAAVDGRDRVARLRADLEASFGTWLVLRGGISSGEVVTGGADGSLATGDPVDSAAWVQQAAAPGDILLDESTHRLVRGAVEVDGAGDDAVRLVELRAAVAPRLRLDAPMVGRARERRRLRDAYEQAVADRSCQLFTILGAPGVGKSRLVEEFVQSVSGEALLARGRCLPYGEGITYWPVLESVREAAGLDDLLSPEENLDRITSILEGQEGAALTARQIAEVVGLSDGSSAPDETFSAVRRLLEALARRQPLVLVFDDIHWGEATFLDLVDHLADWTQDAPVLLVCIARPELLDERPNWGGGKLNATSVLLEPLSEAETLELVENLGGADELDEVEVRRVVEAASGNPLFAEEMLALLLEDGVEIGPLVPPTIQALLAARLDRLPDGEREVIEVAAVEGKLFHEGAVAELTTISRADLDAFLLSLTRKELIRNERPLLSGERAYGFRHLLIRDAAYGSIPKDVRSGLHERYANWLEDRLGDRALDFDEIVGYHLEQSYRYRTELAPVDDPARALGRRGGELLGTAGRRAFRRSDVTAGVSLVSRGIALLPPDDPLRVELVPSVRVVQGVGDLSWADRVLTEAVEAAATSGDRGLAAHALVQRAFLRLFTRSPVTPGELIEVANRAIGVFQTTNDELGLARAWRLVGQAHYLDSKATLCLEASEQALTHARRTGDGFEEREIVEWLVISLLFGSTPASIALDRCEQLVADAADDAYLAAPILSGAATLAAMLGRTDQARDLLVRAREAMTGKGEWVWIVSFWVSYIHIWDADPRGAEEELRPMYEALKGFGETSNFSSSTHALANAVYLQGRYEEAEGLTEECERAAGSNDIQSQIMWRSTRAKCLARRGEFAEARALADAAVGLGESSDFLLAHGDALMDLAEVLRLAGQLDGARSAVASAIDRYETKESVRVAEAARAFRERWLQPEQV